MKVFTIGFTKKTAQSFFEIMKKNDVNLLIDIRLNNSSQLAGFSKGEDLRYFLKEICAIDYQHDLLFAPTKQILEDYKGKKISWEQYEKDYTELMTARKATTHFVERYVQNDNICFLCSETTAEKCHRRLIAELIQKDVKSVNIVHL